MLLKSMIFDKKINGYFNIFSYLCSVEKQSEIDILRYENVTIYQ